MKIFYAMPFTGRTYKEIVEYREKIRKLATKSNLDLLEQFVGVEKKDRFETHGYLPLFIAQKDHGLINMAHVVIADFSGHSIGRDCEIVVAKEVMDKRVISVVPDRHMRNHPYIRLYSNYIVNEVEKAFVLSQQLAQFSLSETMSGFTREQKDQTDLSIAESLNRGDGDALTRLLPTELKRRWKMLFGSEYAEILDWSFKPYESKAIRVNRLKSSTDEFVAIAEKYKWNSSSLDSIDLQNVFRIQDIPQAHRFGTTPELKNGLFYVQDLASILAPIALDPKSEDQVLDLGAAPGSKTTQMAEMMGNRGKILAVDISAPRMDALQNVVKRMGVDIVTPLVADGTTIGDKFPGAFDKVLIDGPCSCEGIFRYKAHKFLEWDLLSIYKLTDIQLGLLNSGYKALKPGGTLVYSTCTYAPEENEAIVDEFLKMESSANLETIHFEGIKTRPGLTEWEHQKYDQSLSGAVRIVPQDNDTIGFFIAKITKSATG